MQVNKSFKFVFKIMSLGGFVQEMEDGVTMLTRPCIWLDENKKRWGNEYLLFRKSDVETIKGRHMIGMFDLDKRRQKNLKIFETCDIPMEYPDYYIIAHDFRVHDLPVKEGCVAKKYNGSFSQLFSLAYLFDEEKDDFKCQAVFVLQTGDVITIGNEQFKLNIRSGKLENAGIDHKSSSEV